MGLDILETLGFVFPPLANFLTGLGENQRRTELQGTLLADFTRRQNALDTADRSNRADIFSLFDANERELQTQGGKQRRNIRESARGLRTSAAQENFAAGLGGRGLSSINQGIAARKVNQFSDLEELLARGRSGINTSRQQALANLPVPGGSPTSLAEFTALLSNIR